MTSWALVDSDLKSKLAYFFTQRAFADQLAAFRENETGIDLVFQNSGKQQFNGRVELKALDISNGSLSEIKVLTLSENAENETIVIYTLSAPLDEQRILLASLYDEKEELKGRNYYLNGEWKHKRFGKELNLSLNLKLDENRLLISAGQAAFFVTLQHPKLSFSDNGFIILPGEEKVLEIYGMLPPDFKVSDIKIFSLNKYLV